MTALDGSSDNSSRGNISTVSSTDCFVFDSVAVKISRVTAYCFIILISVIGNSFLAFIVATERRMQKTLNYFILNMAAADLVITLYMPRAITLAYAGYEWQVDGIAGMVFCKLTVLFHETAVAVSNFTVVAISLDRFFAVAFPLKTFISRKRVCTVIICFIWLVAISLRIPMVYAIKTMTKNGMLSCFLNLDEALGRGAQKGYYYFTLIALFSIPLAVTIILYSSIFISIKRRKPPGEQSAPNEHRARRNRLIKTRVVRMVSIVVGAYILCWLLYFIALILHSYNISVSCDFQFLKLFLAHFNSALNPCLIFTFNANFRKSLKGAFARLPFCNSCGPLAL